MKLNFSLSILVGVSLAVAVFAGSGPIENVRIVSGDSTISATRPLPVVGVQGIYSFQVSRDTTAAGITANEVLAPVIQLDDVAISSTNSVLLHKMRYLSGDADTTNNFLLLICRAPMASWTGTNSAVVTATADMTNILEVIDSSDTATGRWRSVGTNRVWQSYGLGALLKPATNSLFLYFVNDASVTNTNTAYATLQFFKN